VRPDLLILKPETVDHFEAGLKSQWFERRLTVNLTVFHTLIRDYQNTVVDTSRPTPIAYISNVGSVRSRGIELELRARLSRGLNVYGAGTYNIADYKSYRTAQCPWELRAPGEPAVCDLSGQQLPVAPKFSASTGGEYTVRLTDGLNAFVGADYSYRSSYTTVTNNSRYSRVTRVGLVNARLGLKDANGHWQAHIWSQNLLDELYFVSKAVNEQTGRLTGLLGDPRTFGATFRYYFD
jgi:iron complex outermembrane receptor protein